MTVGGGGAHAIANIKTSTTIKTNVVIVFPIFASYIIFNEQWTRWDSNPRPPPYEGDALAAELTGPSST